MTRTARSEWLMVVGLVALGGCGAANDDGGGSGGEHVIAGTVTYRERMALPPGATVQVRLEDVSRADAAADALRRTVGGGLVACRFTHVYPDGAAPYYTFVGPTRVGDELAVWREVKAAVSEALLASGGTITHHHAVGRIHHPWYARERDPLFAAALGAVKRELDPAGVLNPGVIVA